MRGRAGVLAAVALVTVGVPVGRAGAAPLIGCGSVVTRNLVLQTDLTNCTGDGLVVGKAGITIDLHGHAIYSAATRSSSSVVVPGSSGVRNTSYPRVKIIDTSGGRSWIAGFEASIRLTDANRNAVTGVQALDGMWVVRSDSVVIRNSIFTPTNELGCDPYTSPAGIHLEDSDRATIRGNESAVGGLGVVLIRSHNNLVQANSADRRGHDGNDCSGVMVMDSNGNTLKNNDTSENNGDGIFVNATSQHTVIDGNYAEFNYDDGIDVENATTTIINTTTYDSRDLAIEAVPGVTASNNVAVGSGNPLGCLNVVCT
jgi:parallel beta-helix repeat protein